MGVHFIVVGGNGGMGRYYVNSWDDDMGWKKAPKYNIYILLDNKSIMKVMLEYYPLYYYQPGQV